MKIFLFALMLAISFNTYADTACTGHNTQIKLARDAVKLVITIANVPSVIEYYGGVASSNDDHMIVNIQPRFQLSKDWYKVIIRNSDCRIMRVDLFAENLPL